MATVTARPGAAELVKVNTPVVVLVVKVGVEKVGVIVTGATKVKVEVVGLKATKASAGLVE